MKQFILALMIIFTGKYLHGQEISVKHPLNNISTFLITSDSSKIRFDIADTVIKNFGCKFKKRQYNFSDFTFKIGMANYKGRFSKSKSVATDSLVINYPDHVLTILPGDTSFVYGFTFMSGEGSRMNKNYSRILMSAYTEEVNPEYKNNSTNFVQLPVKSKKEFWRRNMINMGYGLRYATKENPFIGSSGLAVGFAYVLETAHYIPILGGPFFGKTSSDKITIPIVGIASLLVWKTVFAGLYGNSNIKTYNKMTTLKYKVPKGLKY